MQRYPLCVFACQSTVELEDSSAFFHVGALVRVQRVQIVRCRPGPEFSGCALGAALQCDCRKCVELIPKRRDLIVGEAACGEAENLSAAFDTYQQPMIATQKPSMLRASPLVSTYRENQPLVLLHARRCTALHENTVDTREITT